MTDRDWHFADGKRHSTDAELPMATATPRSQTLPSARSNPQLPLSAQTSKPAVKAAFELESRVLRLSQIMPVRTASAALKASRKYRTMVASVREVGIVEPLVVYPQGGNKYVLLDGNLRYAILKDLNVTEVTCLVSTDDESFTYNHKINRLSPIQEHRMIVRALDSGVPEHRIAAALDIDVARIRKNRDLLVGICPEAVELLKDRPITKAALAIFKKVMPLRQVEMAELTISVNNYSTPYVAALLAATPQAQLLGAKDGAIGQVSAEDLARMEKEMDQLGKDFLVLEESHGRNVLNLVLARGYLEKLLNNAKVVRYLATKCPDVLTEFQRIVELTSLEG